MSKRRGGRPTKFNADRALEIVTAVAAGCYLETAAAKAGVSKDTLHSWLRQGARSKSGELREFSDSIGQALGQSEARLLGHIARAGEKPQHWQANAWLLERKFPKKYGLRVRVHIEEQLNAFLDACEAELDQETYDKVLSIAERLGEEQAGEAAPQESGAGI